MRGHVLVQLHGHGEFPEGFQGLVQLDLAAIEVEALLDERIGQIPRGDGAEELIVLAGLAGE